MKWLASLQLAVEAESASDAAEGFAEMLAANGVRRIVIRVTDLDQNESERYFDGYGAELAIDNEWCPRFDGEQPDA